MLVSSGDRPSCESLSSVLHDESNNIIDGSKKNLPQFLYLLLNILAVPFLLCRFLYRLFYFRSVVIGKTEATLGPNTRASTILLLLGFCTRMIWFLVPGSVEIPLVERDIDLFLK